MTLCRTTPLGRWRDDRPARRARLAGWFRTVVLTVLVLQALLLPPVSAQPPAPGRPGSDDELVTLNFQDADLDVVLDAVAQAVGFNYVLAPEVRRRVTVQGRVPRRELFDMLLAILEVHGLTAVRSGDLYKIVRIATAQAQGLPVVVGAEPDPSRRAEEIVTQLIPLRYGSAAELARVLQPLIGRETAVAVHRDTNILMITDSVEKLRRYLSVIRMLDVPTAQEQLQIFPLRFADATALAPLITQLVGGPPAAAPRVLPVPLPRAGEGPEAAPGPALRESAAGRAVILADSRTNTLLAVGPPSVLERIQTLVTRLDTPSPPARGVFVYRVEHLRAKELATTLTGLFRRRAAPEPPASRPPLQPPGPPFEPSPGVPGPGTPLEGEDLTAEDIRVIADEATNSLLVTATPQSWAILQPILQRLDRMPRRVLIEILVAEFTLDDSTSFGIQWALRSDNGIKIGGERLSMGFPTTAPNIVPLPPTFFFILRSADVVTLLQAFSAENRVNVLSSPRVLASENKRAQIHVGRSVPILTSQQQPTTGVAGQAQPTSVITTTVEYRDTGIILSVTPRVSDNRFVAVDVRQEVSDVIPNQFSSTQSPVFTKRVAETSVVVGESESLILGGLIEEQKVRERTGIPFLSRIPILGYLFGATTEAIRKTELMIIVTPRLVMDPAEAQSVYEEFKRRAPELKRQIEDPTLPAPPVPAPRPPRSEALPGTDISSR
jgi:general secretion pathway protein D